ncbi:MAG TPA: YhbY family RNA-binding protein [Opitutales bacterium]|nr:YhbY family RNA-binding protein [Opitutales bacterium]
MNSFQKSFLRGLGQRLRPTIRVGKKSLDEGFIRELQLMLDQQELVKVKFAAHKEEKKELSQRMAEEVDAEVVGMIGHNVLLYKEHPDPEKRHIRLPKGRDDKSPATEEGSNGDF